MALLIILRGIIIRQHQAVMFFDTEKHSLFSCPICKKRNDWL